MGTDLRKALDGKTARVRTGPLSSLRRKPSLEKGYPNWCRGFTSTGRPWNNPGPERENEGKGEGRLSGNPRIGSDVPFFLRKLERDGQWETILDDLASRRTDPYSLVEKVMAEELNRKH